MEKKWVAEKGWAEGRACEIMGTCGRRTHRLCDKQSAAAHGK